MKQRICRSIILISILTCLVSTILVSTIFYNNGAQQLKKQLHTKFTYLLAGYQLNGVSYLQSMTHDGNRVTLIDPKGKVIFDNRGDVQRMNNHSTRPEFLEAHANGVGEGRRSSVTLAKENYYYAELLADGNVLRISEDLDSLLYMFLSLVPKVVLLMIVIIIGIFFFSRIVTQNIVAPFFKLSLLSGKMDIPYNELKPFINKIREQNELIQAQLATLQRHDTEFRIIFENMTEGLMLVDSNCQIKVKSVICDRFLRLLGLLDAEGKLIDNAEHLAIDSLHKTLKQAINTSVVVQKNDKFFNFLINPIVFAGVKAEGAIIVIIDVTEQANREKLRREFSANVSHELKTPLTSISGFAEIIRNGIVKPQDIQHFAGKIYEESQRLLSLIADIIHLSALDENANLHLAKEEVDLLAMTQDIMYYLQDAAEQKYIQVSFADDCKATLVQCVPHIIEEALYNLCDNAIKYNRLKGRISFRILPKNDTSVMWQISDTGIGIPYEAQDRVFERFFRVDKSHSRAIGGTGLGLSIVKHGIAMHGGTIELVSVEGQGATFTIYLPLSIHDQSVS